MKIRITNYTFDASAKTITFNNFLSITLDGVLLITNVTDNLIIYNFADPAKGGSVTGNVLTLDYNTASMSDTDSLLIYYDEELQRTLVGNAQKKFRDGFALSGTQPDPNVWNLVNPTANHIITQGGNSSATTYLRISLSPFDVDSEVSITTKDIFSFPFRSGFGISTSQRIFGQEVGMEVVGVDNNSVVETITPIADIDMPVSVTVATANVLPIVTATAHGLHGGDRVVLSGCYNSRINGGPLVVTVIDSVTFSLPLTIATGTYNTTGGHISWADPLAYAKNATSILLENTTVTNGSFLTRRNGSSFRSLNSTISTTTASQTNTSPYTDAFNSASNQEIYTSLEEISFRSYGSDTTNNLSGSGKWTQGIPDEENNYKLRIRAKNLKCLTIPVARITTISKSGSTTATVNTDAEHGLTVGDFIQIYGVLDQTNYPNLSTAVVVTGTPTTTSFTCIIGTSSTTNSVGGVVWRIQGGQLAPGVVAGSIQSITRTNNILSVVNGSTWATPLPGEYFHLYGMQGGASAYDGAYKVLRVNTTTLELESVGANIATISNTGGTGFRRTDVRIHFVRLLDYTRLNAEIIGGKGNSTDQNNAVPVSLVTQTIPTITTVTTLADQTNIGAASADMMAENNSYQDWGLSVRNNLL